MTEENENIFEDEDVILPDDFDDIPTSEEEGNEEEVVDQEEGKTNLTEEETTKNNEGKDKEILEYLNSKGIKYNGQEVKLDNLDDLINTYQKGLNYDKKVSRENVEEDEVLSYVSKKASEANLSISEYIKQVQSYEEQQRKAKEEADIQDMIANNIPEDVAKEIIETRALREQVKREKAELEEAKAKAKTEAEKDKEFEDFIKEYPDVKAEDIPKEVFEDAKNSNLLSAYVKYENKQLKEKLKIKEQNQTNASSSVVKLTSDGSEVDQQSKDAFLMGFDSE